MSDFVEWEPKHHGHKPPYWKPDMLASVDGKNFVLQTNWAWIAGSTYYVPHEAVGMVREDVKERATEEMTDEELCGWLRSMLPPSGFAPAENWWAPWLGADRIEALTVENERLKEGLRRIMEETDGDFETMWVADMAIVILGETE